MVAKKKPLPAKELPRIIKPADFSATELEILGATFKDLSLASDRFGTAIGKFADPTGTGMPTLGTYTATAVAPLMEATVETVHGHSSVTFNPDTLTWMTAALLPDATIATHSPSEAKHELPFTVTEALGPKYFTIFRALVEEEATKRVKWQLPGPVRLTTKKADGNFSVKSHIGGEEFILRDVYEGKVKGMIGIFIPVGPTGYASMEMPLAEASSTFGRSFDRYLDGLASRIEIPRSEVASGTPDTLDEQRTKDYNDFGSW